MPSCMCAGVACVAQHEDVTSCSRTRRTLHVLRPVKQSLERVKSRNGPGMVSKIVSRGARESAQPTIAVCGAWPCSTRSWRMAGVRPRSACCRPAGCAAVHKRHGGCFKALKAAASGGLPGAPSARLRRCALPAHVRCGEWSGKWQTKALLGGCAARTGTWLRPHIFNTPTSS